MNKHRIQGYIAVLSTVSMLNSGCSLQSNQLGINPSDNNAADSSINRKMSALDIKANPLQGPKYTHIFLSGIGLDGEQQFSEWINTERKKMGDNVDIWIPNFRNEKRNNKKRNDFRLSIEQQVEGIYQELIKTNKNALNRPLIITGHSQGGIVAFAFYQKYKDKLNINMIELINTPLTGMDPFRVPFKNFSQIETTLSDYSSVLPFSVPELLKVVKKAVEQDLGDRSLLDLINSANDPTQQKEYREKLGSPYEELMNILQEEHKGIIDMENYTSPSFEAIRTSSQAKSSNDFETHIQLIHSSIDQSTIDNCIKKYGFFIDRFGLRERFDSSLKTLKVINGMNPDDEVKPTDTIVSASNGLCRTLSFDGSLFKKIIHELPDGAVYTFSPQELKLNNYSPNVGITFQKGSIHVAPKLLLPERGDTPLLENVDTLSKILVPLLPKSVIDDPDIQEKSMQIISERLKLNGQRETNSGTIQDDSDLD